MGSLSRSFLSRAFRALGVLYLNPEHGSRAGRIRKVAPSRRKGTDKGQKRAVRPKASGVAAMKRAQRKRRNVKKNSKK